MRQRAFELIESEQGLILEIGCGYGNFAEIVMNAFQGGRYVGIDRNEEKIRANRQAHPNLSFECLDMTRSEFAQMQYLWDAETVCSFQTFEHVGKIDGFEDVCLLSRIRPGCEIIISVPNFKSADHKRWFTLNGWIERYRAIIRIDHVIVYKQPEKPKKRCFLIHGRRRDD